MLSCQLSYAVIAGNFIWMNLQLRRPVRLRSVWRRNSTRSLTTLHFMTEILYSDRINYDIMLNKIVAWYCRSTSRGYNVRHCCSWIETDLPMGLLPDTYNCGLHIRRECRERFPRQRRLAIPTCITARASRTCRDACRDRKLAVSF